MRTRPERASGLAAILPSVRRLLTGVAFLAVVGAGTAASVQLWLHAFGVRESLTARELGLPGARQRGVPEIVIPSPEARKSPAAAGARLRANPLLPPAFLAPSSTAESASSPSGSTASNSPTAPGAAQAPTSSNAAASPQLASAAAQSMASSPQPNRATATNQKQHAKRHPRARRGSKRHATPAMPAAPARPTPAVPSSGTKSGKRQEPTKHGVKSDKHGKPPKPAAPSQNTPQPSEQPGGGSANGHADEHGNGAGHGKGHGK